MSPQHNPYLRNCWYVACWSHDVDGTQPLTASILGEPIVLWRAAGHILAFEDRCVHRLAPLSLGRCEDGHLRCMYHGLVYDADGRVCAIPGQATIPPNARVKTYVAVERHSWVWVWMGDAEKADLSLIPDAVGLDNPEWVLGSGQIDYDAEASLINDNLLDFSHVSFVHANSFQSGGEFADAQPKWESLPHGMRYTRWSVSTTRPVGGEARASNVPVDDYMTYDFLIPGILLMYTGSFPAGTAEACEFGAPPREKAMAGVSFSSQAVTPIGPGRARYFFSAGPHRDHGDEGLRDLQMQVAHQAFAEDKLMIEAQQKIIEATPNPSIMPTAHDRAITQFNRMVVRLKREEQLPLAGEGEAASLQGDEKL